MANFGSLKNYTKFHIWYYVQCTSTVHKVGPIGPNIVRTKIYCSHIGLNHPENEYVLNMPDNLTNDDRTA